MKSTGKHTLHHHNLFLYLSLLILSFAGIILLRYITPFGLGLVNDSVGYIAGARNLIAGYGYTRLTGNASHVPITNYPPMYPLALSIISLSGLEVIRAARLLNLLCFAANIFLCGMLSYHLTRSQLLGILGAALMLIAEPFLQIHAYALSEPLYLCFTLIMLLCLVNYALDRMALTKRSASLLMAGAGFFACLGYLTRYPGVALFATAFVIIFLYNRSWRLRIHDSLIFLGASLPVVIAWSIRNAVVSGNPANRTLSYHPIPQHKVLEGINNLWSFLLPDNLVQAGMQSTSTIWMIATLLLVGSITAILAISAVYVWKNPAASPNPDREAIILLGSHALLYLAMLILTLTFLDASPIFEHRILSPAYLSMLILIPIILVWMIKKVSWGRITAVILGLLLVTSFTIDSLPTIREFHASGQGYISLRWQRSSLVEVVKELPPITLFSNKTQALYLLAERPAYVLVSPLNPATQSERPDYDATMDTVRQMVLDGEAALVIFDFQELISNSENAWMLDLTRDLPVYGDYWDGTIFALARQ